MNLVWNAVREAAKRMRLDDGRAYEWGEDDEGMRTASEDDLAGWVDDCEARLGCSGIGEFRAAVLDFRILAHGADDNCPDVQAHRAELIAADWENVKARAAWEGHAQCVADLPPLGDLVSERIWKNDACARFYRASTNGRVMELWCDYHDPKDRELCDEGDRFGVQVYANEDATLTGEFLAEKTCDDPAQVRAMIEAMIREWL